jgi:secreted trypsin-like serine protease
MNQFDTILKFIKITLGVGLVISLFACGADDMHPGENFDIIGDPYRVINGNDVLHGEYPWQAQISYSGQGHTCGGSLITDRWILTAGHCAKGLSADRIFIVLGEHQLSANDGTEQVYTVDKIVVHPNFNPKEPHYNDIALIRLNRAVTFNDYVQTIDLPGLNDDFTGQNAVATGWGWTKPFSLWGGNTSEDILQEGVLPIHDNLACDSVSIFPRKLKSVELCAGYSSGGQGTCHGDSGGPLVVKKNGKWTLVGVVSWGQGLRCSTYGVFARVTSFISWIKNIIDDSTDGEDPQCWEECYEVGTGCNKETVCETICEE